MDNVNIKKLASELNLSISTVSRALRDSYDISQDTKKRVKDLAEKLNYQPNPFASSLRRQKSKTIAVIIPEIANNFFTIAIDGIESIAQEKGYHVLIYLTHEDYNKEVSFVKHLHSGRVDGVLTSLSSTTSNFDHLDELQSKGIPIVFFDRVYPNMETIKVTTDDYESAYRGTKHLIDRGCKKIAYLLISKNLSIGNNRMDGYLQALKDSGIVVDNNLVYECGLNNKENLEQVTKLLSKEKPDGVFASVEKLAMTTYAACEKLGLHIPGDVKIISFSNLEIASLLKPSLTTIAQPAFEMGKQAASILFKAIEKKNFKLADETIIMKSKLVVRGSTAKA